jgi:hypothetical protein
MSVLGACGWQRRLRSVSANIVLERTADRSGASGRRNATDTKHAKPTIASSNLSNANSSECELHHYEYWQHRLYQLQLNDGANEQLLYVDFRSFITVASRQRRSFVPKSIPVCFHTGYVFSRRRFGRIALRRTCRFFSVKFC